MTSRNSPSTAGVRRRRFRAVLMTAAIPALALASSVGGCVSVRTAHGYILERGENALTGREGIDTKESVIAKYGEPSMRATFDDDSWYYLANRDAARAFFRPDLTSQNVVVFRFDQEGVVQSIEEIDLSDSVRVSVIGDVTPTRGKELSVWEQLLGNVGRLPAAPGQGGIGGGPGGGVGGP